MGKNDWWETDDWPVNQQAAEDTRGTPAVGDASAAWTRRCRCGEPATHRLVYVWVGDGAAERDVCDVHYDTALDFFERVKDQPAVAGLRILVAA